MTKSSPTWFDHSLPLLIVCALLAACIGLSGCSTVPTASPDKSTQEPMNAHDARAAQAQALQQIGVAAKDAETQRLAIFAVMALGQGGALSAPAPAPVVVGNRSIGDAIFGFLDRTLERAINVAPAYLAYKGQVRSADTTERIAGINRDVSINQSNNFLALGAAGINGTSATGIAGVNALATVATRPAVPTTNISGNTGPVLVGGGNLNNGSLNPVNPAPVVCGNSTTTGVVCSR